MADSVMFVCVKYPKLKVGGIRFDNAVYVTDKEGEKQKLRSDEYKDLVVELQPGERMIVPAESAMQRHLGLAVTSHYSPGNMGKITDVPAPRAIKAEIVHAEITKKSAPFDPMLKTRSVSNYNKETLQLLAEKYKIEVPADATRRQLIDAVLAFAKAQRGEDAEPEKEIVNDAE